MKTYHIKFSDGYEFWGVVAPTNVQARLRAYELSGRRCGIVKVEEMKTVEAVFETKEVGV